MKSKNRFLLPIMALVILGVAIALTLYLFSAPTPLPVNAPAVDFSAGRAMNDLEIIAKKPHPMGVFPAHAEVRDYLMSEIRAVGLEPQVQDTFGLRLWGSASGYLSGGFVQNILTRLPGTDPKGAILLMAHYDSTPGAPGAEDDGAGVIILLEILRNLRASPSLRHDVIFLFTDGEEPGTFGAHAFVAQHPWFQEVNQVINLDGIGDGPPGLAQTNQANGIWIQALAQGSERPTYLSLPVHLFPTGDSDMIPFNQADLTGVGYGTATRGQEIHTMLDLPENVNPGTIQQVGNHVLGMVRYLGNKPTLETGIPDQTFFPVIGRLIHYPSGWALPLAVLAGIFFLVTLFAGFRRRVLTWKGLGLGFLASLSTIALSVTVILLLWLGIQSLHPEYQYSHVRPHLNADHLYAIGFVILMLALTSSLLALTRVKISSLNLAAGSLVFWLLASVAASILVAETSYLGTWVLLIHSMAFLLALAVQSREKLWTVVGTGFLVSAIVATFLWVPVISIAFLSTGFTMPWLMMGVSALWLVALLPVLDWITSPQRAVIPIAAALIGFGFLLAGHFQVGRNSPPPLVNPIGYWLEAGEDQASWIAFIGGHRTDARTTTESQVAFPDEMDERQKNLMVNPIRQPYTNLFPEAPPFSVLTSEAPLLEVDGPKLVVMSDGWVDGHRLLTARFTTSMHDRLYIIIPGIAIQGITVPDNERVSMIGSDELWMRFDGMPVDGMEISFEFDTTDRVRFLLVEEKTGLPFFPGLVTQTLPGTMRSPGEFLQGDATDFTAVYKPYEIPALVQ